MPSRYEPLTRDAWFKPKFRLLEKFAVAALIGLAAVLVSLMVPDENGWRGLFLFIAFCCIAPLFFWLAFIPVLHWRDRYSGDHPYTWGAFLVFENTGWTKLIYWFVHVLRDKNQQGRYAKLD